MTTATNGVQSGESTRPRPYIVLEESTLRNVVKELLERADVGLTEEERSRLDDVIREDPAKIYRVVAEELTSRNAAHALSQVGRSYEAGTTPPLVAVSERQFKPRKVNVSFDPKVSFS